MDINKRNAYELLINNNSIKIPYFQREYVWDNENIRKLIDDIKKIITNNII